MVDPRIGKPNEEGKDARMVAGVCMLIGVMGVVVGQYRVGTSLVFLIGGLLIWAASAVEHRRKGLTPLEAWALRPARLGALRPVWVWAAVAGLSAVGFAIGAALHAYWAMPFMVTGLFATKPLAWLVLVARDEHDEGQPATT